VPVNLKTKIIIFAVMALLVFLPFTILKIKSKGLFSGVRGPQFTVVEGYISEGDLLGNVLAEQGIGQNESNSITAELKKVFNVRRCNVGDRWEIHYGREGEFAKFIYYDGPVDFYVVEASAENNGYIASARKVEGERVIRGTRGRIMSSLYESMSNSQVNPELVIQFAEIFASKIDFFTDCRKDDEFRIFWESYIGKDGTVLKDMRISAASYTLDKETFHAFYFETPEGKGGYYDTQGKSVEAVFLKVPLNYRRISSYFTRRRFHPILKRYRPHLGIDYAAASGTPVSSIGDGSVTAAGRRRDGLGITVIVRHPNGYNSWYGHLSGIARGVSRGAKVRKGQVIGYVGSTGTATGPHLDFRLQRNGKFANFLVLKMPPSHPLPKEYMEEFENTRKAFMQMYGQLKQGEIVIFENIAAAGEEPKGGEKE